MPLDQNAPVVVVSADSHVGPRLREDLRDYCPSRYLDDYDALIAQTGPIVDGQALLGHPNAGPGHYDSATRLKDMDSDGVAAEVIYHGSQNGEPLPWGGSSLFGIGTFDAFDRSLLRLSELGCDIYDRWLADFCAADPRRLLGLVHIPAWDIDKSTEVVRWAARAGLRGVNFPVCGRAGIRAYNDTAWDPFWAACVDNGITLHTHGNGATVFDSASGPGAEEITITDVGSWTSRRAAHFLIYGQVFDRFPDLKLVITEVEEPVHLLALRNVMSRVPREDAVGMTGLNGIRALGLDGEYLAGVAARIAAPTVERLTTPVERFPDILPLCMAFAGQSGPRPLEREEMHNFSPAPR